MEKRPTPYLGREAVRLALSSGRTLREIAADLGMGFSTLTQWLGQERDASFPISRMRRVLGVSLIGVFAWQDRPACRRQQQDMVYLADIRMAFAPSNGTYGSPRTDRDRPRPNART